MILSTIFENKKDPKSTSPNKGKSLNPYAAEFVPSSFKYLSGDARKAEPSSFDATLSLGKAILDQSWSNASNYSDDEAHQYWHHQLPDDITPDFGVAGEDELQMVGGLSLSGLSIHDGAATSQFGTSGADHTASRQSTLTVHGINGFTSSESTRSSCLDYNGDQTLTPFTNLASSQWNKRFEHGTQISGKEDHYTGYSYAGFPSVLVDDYSGSNIGSLNRLEFLAAKFPDFTAEYLADVYYSSCCDFNLTLQILSQSKLQVNGGFSEDLNLKTLSAPSLAAIDYPSLSLIDVQNGLLRYDREDQQASSAYQPVARGSFAFPRHGPVGTPTDGMDLASTVSKCKPENACRWKYERNGSSGMNVGSTGSLRLLANSYSGHGNGKSLLMDKLQSPGTAQASFNYLKTGDAVGNMYSESMEEARDLPLLQSAHVEKARQSSLLGNKTSTKKLSVGAMDFRK